MPVPVRGDFDDVSYSAVVPRVETIRWCGPHGAANDGTMGISLVTSNMSRCLQCFDTVGWVAGRASGL